MKEKLKDKRFNKLVVVSDETIKKNNSSYLECKCDCGNTTYARKSDLISGKRKSCGCKKYEEKIKKIIIDCIFCDKKTSNPKFCSQNCAAKYNNKYRKRKYKKKCKICDTKIRFNNTFCNECKKTNGRFRKDYSKIKLKDVIYDKHHRSSSFALVRTAARKIAKKNNYTKCVCCGYDKHIEISHIKAIKDFNKDTTIDIINDLSNLVPLCPNCHWEFDNGLISKETILERLKNNEN